MLDDDRQIHAIAESYIDHVSSTLCPIKRVNLHKIKSLRTDLRDDHVFVVNADKYSWVLKFSLSERGRELLDNENRNWAKISESFDGLASLGVPDLICYNHENGFLLTKRVRAVQARFCVGRRVFPLSAKSVLRSAGRWLAVLHGSGSEGQASFAPMNYLKQPRRLLELWGSEEHWPETRLLVTACLDRLSD